MRLFWEETPVDLFFTHHPFHERAAAHTEEVPLGDTHIPILAATDLAVFKAFFDRTRDWADIEAMVDERTVDLHIVIGWIVDLLGRGRLRVNGAPTRFTCLKDGDRLQIGSAEDG